MRRTRAQTRAQRREAPATKTESRSHEPPAAPPPHRPRRRPHATADAEGSAPLRGENLDEPAGNTGSTEMAEYERKRLGNIQRNLEFLRSMGVATAKIAARTAASSVAPSSLHPTGRTGGISTKRKPREPQAPVRKSRRIEGKAAELERGIREGGDGTKVPHDVGDVTTDAPGRLDPRLDAASITVSAADGGGHRLLQTITAEADEEDERDLRVDSGGVETVRYALTESDVIKAAQERIYSLAFHPRTDRVIVAAGDKRGHVSLWDADAPTDDDDAKGHSVVAMYRPHTLPTTQLHFAPSDPAKLLSASFDGTVREFDLKAATFTEWFALDRDAGGVTSLALGPNRGQYLASAEDGHVWRLDRRLAPGAQSGFLLHEKKINTVHQHPLAEFCFATASLDRTVCLWDSRVLKKATNKPLLTLPHTRSVNCAYFSPNGKHLVTVGQDDYIRVYDTHDTAHLDAHDVAPTLRIPHNNQTGRWLTKLHAAWDPKRPDQYVMGCMQQPRRLQIFDATRKNPIQELTSELFASVHSINVFHPTLNLLAGGNSSGRLCLWRPEPSSS